MTVKRILSVVLSVIMIMASLVSVSAVSDADIDITTDVNEITIKVNVPEDVTGTMTAQILNTDLTEIFAIGSDDKTDGKYEFVLTMHKASPSAMYTVRIGGNIEATKADFKFTNNNDLVAFYKGFVENKADASALRAYLESAKNSPDGLSEYNGLLENIKDVVTAVFASDEAIVNDAAKVKENTANFRKLYADTIKLADVANVKNADDMQAIIDDTEYANFETYTGKGDLTLSLKADDLYTFYAQEVKAVDTAEEFTIENFRHLYDRANFMCVANKKGWGYMKDAYDYYLAKGTLALTSDDKAEIANAVSDGSNELWIDLCARTDNTSVEVLLANAVAIAKGLNAAGGNDGGFGGGGGGGGGGKAPASTDVPTTAVTPGANIDKTETSAFIDLGTAEWAREAIEALAARGVLNGKEAGRFVPNDNVTREEITKIITSAFGLVQMDAECEFADVAADRWSYVYVASASRLGVVNGYGADFGPANKTTREDMAVMIYRVLKLMNINVSGTAASFTDASSISPYARDAVSALVSAGIINGMGDGTFAPKAYVTRAQIAKVAYELLNLAGGNQ